jgi:mono/diheme cytochrome c family protein
MRTLFKWVGLSLLLLFGIAQVIPYGRAHKNPPASKEASWDSPRTKELFDRACADCHSNRTRWPWYSVIAPLSWMVQRHVDEGREKLNMSALAPSGERDNAAEEILEREMPIASYLWLHPEAKLTNAERRELALGMAVTLGGDVHWLEREQNGGEEEKEKD